MVTGQRSEVSNYEGYAATMFGLLELGDTSNEISNELCDESGWDQTIDCGEKDPYPPVRFYLSIRGLPHWRACWVTNLNRFDALSLSGELLYTRGPGEPYGFDGIGPFATWSEGTLSYIALKRAGQ